MLVLLLGSSPTLSVQAERGSEDGNKDHERRDYYDDELVFCVHGRLFAFGDGIFMND